MVAILATDWTPSDLAMYAHLNDGHYAATVRGELSREALYQPCVTCACVQERYVDGDGRNRSY